MSQEFKFTDPGEGLQEAEILEVHVSDGDHVQDGDTVLTVETDKANTDLPAPFTGTIENVRVAEGDVVEIGDILMTYSEGNDSGDADQNRDENQGQKQDQNREEARETNDEKSGRQAPESDESSPKSEEKTKRRSDSKQNRSEDDDAKDTEEKGGKRKDRDKQRERNEKRESSGQSAERSGTQRRGGRRNPVPAAPSTRRLAREKGIDLHEIEASGKQGRVTAEDVEAAAVSASAQVKKSKDVSTTSPLTPGVEPPSLPDFSQWGKTERVPLRSIRRATAQNMARSWAQIPHVYHQDIADVTDLERFRRGHETEHGKLTLTVLVMKALVSVLKRFPRFNASLDVQNREIVFKHYFHMGLAVATDRGLLVPVIRDVDRKNIVELAAEAADIARKTRNGELSREDMQGGSITVTNPGPMGGSSLTPLINHPQVAILGMGQARLEPVVSGDLDNYEITARLRLPLVLGFDHRVNDGADAARFVTALIETLADPESLLLAV